MHSQSPMQSGNTMDDTMMRMAELCEQMMKKSMAVMPYVFAVGIGLASLLMLALLLLVILEVQWIIIWARRLKAQK